ncbi:MAG: glycosyltransferase family 25 protein [Coleofasciculus sp. B1-GNL1-01]|uniref:glycosyltransferase family 25 protein n=1 Tax=Coleofasciculus sp. B1-GNL1-01 TaxID=3068484 RepID=UPI0032FEEDE2
MKIIDYFDRIYIIYMPERSDRFKHIKNQVHRLGIEKDNNKLVWFPGLKYEDAAGFPKASVRGCAMSHYMVMKQANEEGVEKLLVLEDDCLFSRRLIRNEQEIVDELKSSAWDFVYLGHGSKIKHQQQNQGYFIKVAHNQKIPLTHFCAYHGRVMPDLIQMITDSFDRAPGHPEGSPMGFDAYMTVFRRNNPDKITLMASRSLGGQCSSASNLTPGQLEQYKLIKPILRQARRLKNVIRSFE